MCSYHLKHIIYIIGNDTEIITKFKTSLNTIATWDLIVDIIEGSTHVK